jgi:hypothetical protein
MKDVSEEYNAKELADVRKPVELYHVWFNDHEDVKLNNEWFFTNYDKPIYHSSNTIEPSDPVEMQIIDLDVNSWQISASEGNPFKMFLVVSLYEKYIQPYDPEWYTIPDHISGIYFWFQDPQFETLEEAFYTRLVSAWPFVYPTIENPYEGVPYDSDNAILETSNFTASLKLNGFENTKNNIYITITSLSLDGNTITVPKSYYTLIEEPNIPEIPYYDYDYDHEEVEPITFPLCYLTKIYDRFYLPATIERENITYNSELEVQNIGVNFLYRNEVAVKFIAVNPVNLLWISILKVHRDQIHILSSSEFRLNFIHQLYEKYVESYDSEWETTQSDQITYWHENLLVSIEDLEESFYEDLVLNWTTYYPAIENPYDGVSYDSDNAISLNLETDVIFLGQIKDVSFKGLQAKATCVSFSHFLKEPIPIWRYQLTCNHRLFDDYCRLTKEDYKIQGEITSIDGLIISIDILSTLEDGYLVGGEIKKNSESRKIISQTENSITVSYVFTELQVEDIVDLYPGCDGRIETCRDTFDNILNYLGFPFIPLEHENPALRTNLSTTGTGLSGTVPGNEGE